MPTHLERTLHAPRSLRSESIWPLVGRTEVTEAMLAVLAGRAGGLVLIGEAGVGKTRIALECLRSAEVRGCHVAHVTATRTAAEIPFGALAPLLPNVRSAAETETRASLLHRHTAALLGHAGERRLVLMVDDAQLLDAASATLVHYVATVTDAALLLTVREEDAIPVPDAIVALWRERVLERLDIGPLAGGEVEALLTSVLDGPVEPGAVLELADRCQGNPLFLRELVGAALDIGALRREDGSWRLTGPLAPSKRLVELVEARLANLDAEQRRLLEIISFGEPLGPAEIETLADLGAAEQLERFGLIISRLTGRRLHVRMAHPMFAEVLRSQVTPLRHRSIARSLAEATEATGARRREDTLRVATWRLECGGAEPGAMFAAATQARWHHDFPLAERLVGAAVDAGAGFNAELLAAQLAGLRGDSARAEWLLADLAIRAESDAERALVAINRLDNQVFYLGHIDEGLRMAAEAAAQITERPWRDEIDSRVAGVRLALEGPRACAEAAAPLLEHAGGRALAWACIAGAYSLGRLGRHAAALDASSRGYRAHLELGIPLDWEPCMHQYFRHQSLAYLGRVAESHDLARAAHEQARAENNPDAQAYSALLLAQLVADLGHVAEAIRFGTEATALFRRLGRPGQVEFGLTYLAQAHALAGDAAAARAALRELDELGLAPSCYVATDILAARAWTAVAEGDLGRAHRYLEEAVERGDELGDHVGESAALHGLARLGRPGGVAGRLGELAGVMEGDLIAGRAEHTRALAERDGKALRQVSHRFEDLGLPLLAAEAAADEAVVHRRGGQARMVASAEWRANALTERCPDARTPALQSAGARADLTRAEREVALLAGHHSNQAIADKLCVSRRTVENHLQNVYGKLGISRRSEIEDVLRNRH